MSPTCALGKGVIYFSYEGDTPPRIGAPAVFILLPIVLPTADHDRVSGLLLTGRGPITGFRIEADGLRVRVDVGAFLLEDYGQPTVDHVTRFVDDVLNGRY